MAAHQCIAVSDLSQVGEVRRAAAKLGHSVALSEARCSDLSIAATELASNLARHAVKGRVLLQVIASDGGEWAELLAVDEGPGIADLQRCLRDGYSSAGTAGTGFGAVRRLADGFDVFSMPGKGTVVMARFRVSPSSAPGPFVVGAVSLPAPREDVCGDTWRVAVRGQEAAVLVADGLGHGPLAAEAAERARVVFDQDPFAEHQSFFTRSHAALTGSRGAVLARALVQGRTVRHAGIGNISATVLAPDGSRGLPSQNGTVGVERPRTVTPTDVVWPARGLLVVHSDGLGSRWTLGAYPGLIVRHPAVIAAVLTRDFIRGRDDTTVVVVAPASVA